MPNQPLDPGPDRSADPASRPDPAPESLESGGSQDPSPKTRAFQIVSVWIIAVTLLLPLGCFLVAQSKGSDEFIVVIAVILTPLLAVAAGILEGIRRGRSLGNTLLLSVGFSIAFLVGAETLLAAGCTWG